MEKCFDLVIIGSGPAGLAAAIYAARAQLETVVIEKEGISGGQIINTYEVDNYPGLPETNGYDLAMKFREHSDKLGAVYETGEVEKLELEGSRKKLTLTNGKVFLTKTVIIAAGAAYRKLGVPGEDKLLGAGVSYCATCDGAFFRNRTAAVIGGGDVAVEDAIFLARLCTKVYVIHRRDSFRAAKVLSAGLEKQSNVEILWNTVVEEIEGEGQVAAVRLRNVQTEETSTISTDGIFIAVGNVPNSEPYRGLVEMDAAGYIKADESCETSVPGIFAAGDIRTKLLRQVITAASDGANAITSVEKYLIEEENA